MQLAGKSVERPLGEAADVRRLKGSSEGLFPTVARR